MNNRLKLSKPAWLLLLTLLLPHLQASAYVRATVGAPAGTPADILGPTTSTSAGARIERHACIYSAAEMASAGIVSNSTLFSIGWNKTGDGNYLGNDLTIRIWLKHTASTSFSANPTFATEIGTATKVYETSTGTIPLATGWVTFVFNLNTFLYDGTSNVEVITEIIRPTSYASDDFNWQSIATVSNAGANGNNASTPPATLSRTSGRNQIQFEVASNGVDGALLNLTGLTNGLPGTQNLGVTLRNTGTTPLTSATVDYSLNGGAPASTPWTGVLALGEQTTLPLGSVSVSNGFNTVEATLVAPNGVTDVFPANDTQRQTVQNCSPLVGAYTINGNAATVGTNFSSFTEFANSLANCGISGPVTATVTAGSGPYIEQVLFRAIAGLGATAPLTIEGNGNTITSDTAILSTGSNPNRYIIRLQDLQYVTINNLSVQKVTGSTAFLGIHVIGSGNRITISNCTLDLSAGTNSSAHGGIVCNGSPTGLLQPGGAFDSLLITGNTFNTGGYGVSVIGGVSPVPLATGVQISNNAFQNTNANAVYLRETDGAQISNNTFDHTVANSATTSYNVIQLAATANVNGRIFGNRIRKQADGRMTGIYVFGGTGHRVFNNAIHDVQSTAGEISAITLRTAASAPEVYFNTISLDHTASTSGNLFGIQTETTGTAANIRNNIISIAQTSTTYKSAFYLNSATGATTTFAISDYNILWVPGGDIAGRVNVTTPNTFANTYSDWKGNTPYDDNSHNIDPQFVSLTQPSPTNPAALNTGTPIAGITEDINGATRNNPPDIGAIEDNVLLSASLISFYGEHRAGANRLYWATASEQGNRGFELQHSADGKAFEKLAFIPTASADGNSHRTLQYAFDDAVPLDGKNYYRLRQLSISGSETTSNIVMLSAGKAPSVPATLYPNPAMQSLTVDFAVAKAGDVRLQITDVSGKLLLTHTVQAVAGKNTAPLPVSGIPAGMYLLRIYCGDGCEASSHPWQKR